LFNRASTSSIYRFSTLCSVLPVLILLSLLFLNHLPISQDVDEILGVDVNNHTIPVTGSNSKQIKSRSPPGDSVKDTVTRVIQEEDIFYQFKIGLVIEDIVLNSQRLRLSYCTNAVIRNVTVNTSNWGVILEGCHDILMVNCTVIDGIAATEITNLTIKECNVRDSEWYFGDIGVQRCNDVTIKNNTLNSTIVTVTDTVITSITGNSVHDGKINIQRCSDVTINDNIMALSEGGIYVYETDNIAITNNTVDSDQGTRSIRVTSSTSISIENNSLSRAYSTTIFITSCSLINITGNDIIITGVGIYIVSANSIVITDNKLSHLSSYSLSCRSCIDFLFSIPF